MRVLVVGADHGCQDLLHTLTKLYGAAAVCSVGSLSEALAYCTEAEPDIVLLDARLPGMKEFAGVHRLIEQRPDIAVAVIAPAGDRASVLAAIRQGARGLIPISATPEILCHALTVMQSGDLFTAAALKSFGALDQSSAPAPRRVKKVRLVSTAPYGLVSLALSQAAERISAFAEVAEPFFC